MGELGASLRYFSGEECDWREHKRWKMWAVNRMRTMDKLLEEARGSFLWTLLYGQALEVVERLKESEDQVKDGEKVILALLDKRWPEKDRQDQIGENVSEVFGLRAREGESLRPWCARAQEVFDRCARKSGVTFPPEAKGWILLNCSGMTETEKAVVMARCQGSLTMDDISQAMRSCLPEFAVRKKKSFGAHLVEDSMSHVDGLPADVEPDEFDVMLSELGIDPHDDDDDDDVGPTEMDEDEAKEVLAATWKEKRAEISRLQRGRRFAATQEVRKSFRVDVEEIRKRSKCWRCNQLGHFAKDCKNAKASSSSSGKSGGKGSGGKHQQGSRENAAGVVEHLGAEEPFICSAGVEASEVLLESSPGYAVLDSGCGRTLIGENTLSAFAQDLGSKTTAASSRTSRGECVQVWQW